MVNGVYQFYNQPHHYGNSSAMWDYTVLPATQQRWHGCHLYSSQLQLVLSLAIPDGCKAELSPEMSGIFFIAVIGFRQWAVFRHTMPWIWLGHRAVDQGLLARSIPTDVEYWATLSWHLSSILLCRLKDHHQVGLGARPTEFELQWIISLPWNWRPRARSRWETRGPENGDVVIMDQQPASVAGRCIRHQSQRACIDAEPVYAVPKKLYGTQTSDRMADARLFRWMQNLLVAYIMCLHPTLP